MPLSNDIIILLYDFSLIVEAFHIFEVEMILLLQVPVAVIILASNIK
jgi:hypothetical protein